MSRKKVLTHGTPKENIASLLAIPADRITDEERNILTHHASQGDDIYAYDDPTSDIWNLWEWDTRILLCPLAKRWMITDYTQESTSYWWQVTISPPNSQDTYTIRLEVYGQIGETDLSYPGRARRVILNAVNHCCNFDTDPRTLEDTHL